MTSLRRDCAFHTAALASVLFPAGCRICDELFTGTSRVPLRWTCLESFAPIVQTSCDICGTPLAGLRATQGQKPRCPVCQSRTYAFAFGGPDCARRVALAMAWTWLFL